jgi:hypothetical protein
MVVHEYLALNVKTVQRRTLAEQQHNGNEQEDDHGHKPVKGAAVAVFIE